MSGSEKLYEGIFAIAKPKGPTSADVLRDAQKAFSPSETFKPWMELEKSRREENAKMDEKQSRRATKSFELKMGHGGTLDPLATGVLIVGVGVGTKRLGDFLLCTKQYEATMVFGACTNSYDRTGKVTQRAPYSHITRALVEEKLKAFRGKIKQFPPIYSALKMNGKKLYEYAREKKPLPRSIQARDVEVLDLEILEWFEPGQREHNIPEEDAAQDVKDAAQLLEDAVTLNAQHLADGKGDNKRSIDGVEGQENGESVDGAKKARLDYGSEEVKLDNSLETKVPLVEANTDVVTAESAEPTSEKSPPAVSLRMTVTSGFYVRSLCHDLGKALGSAGLMTELSRTRQAEFSLAEGNVLEHSDLTAGEEVWGPKVRKFLDDDAAAQALKASQMPPQEKEYSRRRSRSPSPRKADRRDRKRMRRNSSSERD